MPVRGSTRLVRQDGPRGRNGGTCVQGTALNLAAGFSCPFRSHTGAQGLRGEKGSEVPPYPLSPSHGNSSGPAQGRRWRVGIQAKSTWEACGKQGEETAVSSRAARGLLSGLSPHFSVLRGPHRPHPARSCAQHVLSSFGPKQGEHGSEDALSSVLPSSWLLKGQAPVAWVLLELDLLQGEDGGSVFKLVYTLSQRPEVWVVEGCLC